MRGGSQCGVAAPSEAPALSRKNHIPIDSRVFGLTRFFNHYQFHFFSRVIELPERLQGLSQEVAPILGADQHRNEWGFRFSHWPARFVVTPPLRR